MTNLLIQVKPAKLPEVLLIEPTVFSDQRGFFFESYNAEKYKKIGISAEFVQDNHSKSLKGTLRGLHAQKKYPQGKLIRVLQGEIFDVAVDVRKGSPRFGQWTGETLSSENFKQVYVPPGFVHGFCVVSESAEVEYKCTEIYHPEDEYGVIWNDPQLKISWPIKNPILSKKDSQAKRMSDLDDFFPSYP